jgi:methylmalonyl-CoA mutase cobalamin-binding subunit
MFAYKYMDINVVVAALSIGLATIAIYFAREEERVLQEPDHEVEMPPANINNSGHDQGADIVENILRRHGAYEEHAALVDSMVLIVISKKNEDYNLDLLIPEEDGKSLVELGKLYIDRFAKNPTRLDYFLAGVIEMELNNIRTGSVIPIQDVHELRKTVDSFYYKNISNSI